MTIATPTAIVYLVDDEPDVTEGLSWLLDSVGLRSKAFSSAQAFLREAGQHAGVSCLVTDLRMPEMNGLELVQELIARGYRFPVIFLSAHGDVPNAVKAMQLGAVDFVQKPFNPEAFLGSINKALRFAREAESRRLARQTVEGRLRLLSPREREIFEYLLTGQTSKEIGRRLHISFKTVDVHRANLMYKLEVASYGELVRRFASHEDSGLL